MGVPSVLDPVEAYNARVQREGWKGTCDRALAFEDPALAQAARVWQEKARERKMPSRKDLDIRSMKTFIRNVTIFNLERQPDGSIRYRFRLFGTGLAEIGIDLTGWYLDQAVNPKRLSRWTAGYETVIASKQPLRFLSWFETHHLDYLQAESMIAPLSDDGENVSDILVVSNFQPLET